ncbi:MAG: tRNA uridine-5-carboxymethylaminomethyl(34) synthesis GTPase MnmE [Victivallales bacterium]|nr:tRNA uridine-5-carboxymethylaminomethyl(34) synthesis GTPase MnmE [Victivallales bacterium]
MNDEQTIAALCTPPSGAVAVIRISGPTSLEIADRVWKGFVPLAKSPPRTLNLGICAFSSDSSVGDSVLAVRMPAPRSYTGEDVVELHCHGGALVAKRLLRMVIDAGAKHAAPGEFTLRAFINSKLDLTQAEAVADVISARSDIALNLAEKQMSGALRDRMRDIRGKLLTLLSESESHMDFPEEELDWLPVANLSETVKTCSAEIADLLATAEDGAVLREGVRIVIAGRPNVGKSSLLNLLLSSDRAIVTATPGTTRDTIEEIASIRGIPVKLIDTAGIREAENEIEGIGVKRSFESMRAAGIILWVMDASGNRNAELKEMRRHLGEDRAVIAVWNKIDIVDLPLTEGNDAAFQDGIDDSKTLRSIVHVSVLRNTGVERLKDAVEDIVWNGENIEEPEVAVNTRHAELLVEAAEALSALPENLEAEEWELASSKIRSAVFALGTITGEDANPDVLDNIFSRFCIGK